MLSCHWPHRLCGVSAPLFFESESTSTRTQYIKRRVNVNSSRGLLRREQGAQLLQMSTATAQERAQAP